MKVKNKVAGVSLKTLYKEKGSNLKYGKIIKTIEDGNEYYDLYDLSGEYVCSDGEVCEIVWENEHEIKLLNNYGDYDTVFTLTKEEFGISYFYGYLE